ncbi:hypothetical protein [Microbispora sp. NPDC049633]|uniref:hypothetical protein n=1 Tax=Microbispora sp. NPDC049633 TaxID=3154355 RepID=UPI003441F501
MVIGGGYAGTLAANRLRARDDVHVTLVNPRPEFVERIRLHQLVAGTGEAVIDYGTPKRPAHPCGAPQPWISASRPLAGSSELSSVLATRSSSSRST